MKVKDCMCTNVYFVNPDTKVYEVAKLMSENHIGSIPVCDTDNHICGIVTDRDILLRSIACDKDIKQTSIRDIMSCDVCTCNEEDDVTKAESKMSSYQIRRIPVCDNNSKVIGILTLGDLPGNCTAQELNTTIEKICECGSSTKNAD